MLGPLLYFWLLLKASLLSTSGMGNVPILHGDLVPQGFATERQFAESLTIGQLSPGPNGLWVISLGYLMQGIRGSLLALLAITLPPLLILIVDRLYRRVKDNPLIEGFVQGLTLAAMGIFAVVLLGLLRSAGPDLRTFLIFLGSMGLGSTRRVPLLVVLALAAVVGAAV